MGGFKRRFFLIFVNSLLTICSNNQRYEMNLGGFYAKNEKAY